MTGGIGGIGLTMAEHLLRMGAQVGLIIRTPLPPEADWERRAQGIGETARRIKAVQALRQLGRLELAAADVCNPDEMARAVAQLRAAMGPDITGVIHAAGVIDDAPILQKTDAQIARVLAPKVQGLRVLDQVFPDGALETMILFSSSSTATRPAGQVDYVAANEMLNAYAQARQGGATRVVAVDWGIWSEVGMAQAALGQAEAVALDLPLLNAVRESRTGLLHFSGALSTQSWVVDEHRTADGTAIMPGTGYLELAAEAWGALGESEGFVLEDLSFVAPLTVRDQTETPLRVTLTHEGAHWMLEVLSGVRQEGRTGYRLHASGHLRSCQGPVEVLNLDAIRARLPQPEIGDLHSPQERHLRFGPRWQVLKSRAMGAEEGLADLSLSDAYWSDGCHLPAGLMDLATGWAIALAPSYNERDLWVPIHYRRIAVHAPLPADTVSWVRLSDSGADYATFDITLAAPDGTVRVEVEGFSMQRIGQSANLGDAAMPGGLIFDDAVDGLASNAILQHALAEGITPAEGPGVLAPVSYTHLTLPTICSV